MDVDEAVVGGRDRVGANVALLDPRQSSAGERWYFWTDQWLEADVTGLGQEHGTHTDGQISARAPCSFTWVKSEAKPVQAWTSNSNTAVPHAAGAGRRAF